MMSREFGLDLFPFFVHELFQQVVWLEPATRCQQLSHIALRLGSLSA